MDEKTEETLTRVAEYANEEKIVLTKKMRIGLYAALAVAVSAFTLDFFEISGGFSSFVKGFSSGIMAGIILWLLIMTSRWGKSLAAAKQRLCEKTLLRGKKG